MPTTPDKLLLWDIDGTLIDSGYAGERSVEAAWREVMGGEVDIREIDYNGRTDRMIGRLIFEHFQLPLDDHKLHHFVEAYLTNLPQELTKATAGRRLHGVLEALEAGRKRPDIAMGLLTGNMVRGAQSKLTHYDLWHFFEFGAFADDSHIRDELGPHALRRASERYGADFAPERVFVIGDTPHDVRCARIIGARAVAVATGNVARPDLEAAQPDLLFDDLSDTRAFFSAIDHLASSHYPD